MPVTAQKNSNKHFSACNHISLTRINMGLLKGANRGNNAITNQRLENVKYIIIYKKM